jgi:hypothetical protein
MPCAGRARWEDAREVCGGRGLVMGELTNHRGPATAMISAGPVCLESRQLVFTDIHRVDTNHLLKTSRRWDVGTEPETWADQLLLYRGQVVHSAMSYIRFLISPIS